MRIIVFMTFLSLSVMANNADHSIKKEYFDLASRIDKLDSHFGLQRIFASHIHSDTLLNSKEPEKVLLQARISQVESFIQMQGMKSRSIATTKSKKLSMKQRIQRLENIMRRSTK